MSMPFDTASFGAALSHPMKILLAGAGGQLGSQLRTALAVCGDVVALTRASGGDVTDAAAMQRAIDAARPDVIVNATAYTAVDRAEQEPEAAFAVNALACETLARAARAAAAWFIHYSTDYVFDGSGSRPWREDDPALPLSVYGASKLAGEQAIRAVGGKYLVLRTSWVYEPGFANFIGAILGAACKRDALTVVDDQWGTPTRARTIAQATARILPRLEASQAGLYHLAAAGETNRLALAQHALERAQALGWPLRATAARVQRASTADMPSPARRPLNSRLDTDRFERTFGFALPGWTADVDAALEEWPQPAPR
jgi:dTDP-4-dehydrorhamnose reductase